MEVETPETTVHISSRNAEKKYGRKPCSRWQVNAMVIISTYKKKKKDCTILFLAGLSLLLFIIIVVYEHWFSMIIIIIRFIQYSHQWWLNGRE